MDKGSYVEVDGRPAVRFERAYPHSVEWVWRAITQPVELAHWFPSPEVSYEPRVGATIRLGGDPNTEAYDATILAWEPPHRFAFEWGADELRFTLASASDGGCRLELLNVLAEANTAARNATGWTVCLAELDKVVAGEPGAGPHGQTDLEFRPLYESYVAAGLPSGAEIPGVDLSGG
jgi:uncharacterized protein YndB with AHSA1/START domain